MAFKKKIFFMIRVGCEIGDGRQIYRGITPAAIVGLVLGMEAQS
jgi:hypothetical protein